MTSASTWDVVDAAHPRTAARAEARDGSFRRLAHDFEVEAAEEEGILLRWMQTIKHFEPGRLVLERMELDDAGLPQPTGEVDELEADSLVLALGQESDLSLLLAVDGVRIEDGIVRVGPDLMTGHPGIFAGGDIVPAERHGDGRRRARRDRGAAHRRVAARRRYAPAPRARARGLQRAQHLVLRRRAHVRDRPRLPQGLRPVRR